jgi:hypothetical protein
MDIELISANEPLRRPLDAPLAPIAHQLIDPLGLE